MNIQDIPEQKRFVTRLQLANTILDSGRPIVDPEQKIPLLLNLILKTSSVFLQEYHDLVAEGTEDKKLQLQILQNQFLEKSLELALSTSQNIDHRINTLLTGAQAHYSLENTDGF